MNELFEEIDYDFLNMSSNCVLQNETNMMNYFSNAYDNINLMQERDLLEKPQQAQSKKVYFKIIRNPIRKKKTKTKGGLQLNKSVSDATEKDDRKKKARRSKKALLETASSANSSASTVNSNACFRKKSRAKPDSKLKRMMRNRANAQRVRERQKQYTQELELKIQKMQEEQERILEENKALRSQVKDMQTKIESGSKNSKPFESDCEKGKEIPSPILRRDTMEERSAPCMKPIKKQQSQEEFEEIEEEEKIMEEFPKVPSKKSNHKRAINPGMFLFYALVISTLFGFMQQSNSADALFIRAELTNKDFLLSRDYFDWNLNPNIKMDEPLNTKPNHFIEKGRANDFEEPEPDIELRKPDLSKYLQKETKMIHSLKPSSFFKTGYYEEESKQMDLEFDRFREKEALKKGEKARLDELAEKNFPAPDDRNLLFDPALIGEDLTDLAWFG